MMTIKLDEESVVQISRAESVVQFPSWSDLAMLGKSYKMLSVCLGDSFVDEPYNQPHLEKTVK